jgi:hypothetical protein
MRGENILQNRMNHLARRAGMINSYSKSYFWARSPLQASAVFLKNLLEKLDVLGLFAENIKRGEDLDGCVRSTFMGDLHFSIIR